MDDLDFYLALAALPDMPDALRAELGRRQLAAHRARRAGGAFTLARTDRRDCYVIGDRRIETDAIGMRALTLAVLNPGGDVSLGKRRTRRAWRAAIDRALAATEPLAPGLARVLGPPDGRHAPGLSLRVDADGCVIARWTRAPNVQVQI